MAKARDPLGKRALFSGGPAEQRKRGVLDFTVHCSSCDTRTTLSAPELIVQNLPVSVWFPWRKHSRLMRCPACDQLAWHAVSLAR